MTKSLIKLEQLALGRELKLLGKIELGIATPEEMNEFRHYERQRKKCSDCQTYRFKMTYETIREYNDEGAI